MATEITAFAPASVSNVACGFDIMGFALDEPGDRVTVRFSNTPGVHIREITGTTRELPREPSKNTAAAPIAALLRRCGTQQGVEVDIYKGVPVSGGIGSSAASAVAAAVAANALLGAGLSLEDLLPYALEGERIASGAIHVDNLSPSLWGGFVLVRGYDPIDLVHLPVPAGLWCAVVAPHREIETKASRRLLPEQVPLSVVIRQTGNAAGLVAGLFLQDFGLISRSLHDAIAEPVRKKLIPGFDTMQSAALAAGALGCSISGSGPSVFALATSKEIAQRAGAEMGRVLDSLKCTYDLYVSTISRRGATIL